MSTTPGPTTTDPADHGGDPPAARRPFAGPSGVPSDPEDVVALEAWFDRLAAERTHPAVAAARMRRSGWGDGAVRWADGRYRARWSAHPAVWWGGFSAIGVAALAVAGVLHALIDGHPDTAADWFGIAIVAWVFGGVATVLMGRLADDWSQRFSAPRRMAATTLFWSAIGVAVIRGLVYGQVLGHELLVGDHCTTDYDYDPETASTIETSECEDRGTDALAHLALTGVVATPIACWAWYGHRKPTDPPALPEVSAG